MEIPRVERVTIEGYEGSERVLLSYDVSGATRPKAARVCHIVFGRTRRDGPNKERVERGFIHRPGVVWVGQSVLVLPPRDADELRSKLRALGVRVSDCLVGVTTFGLRAFRRPR